MTKKIKRKFKSVLLVLLAIVIVCSQLVLYAWFAPYGRHKVSNKEPFITEEFLPKPDSIAVIRGGIAVEVSDEKRDQLYDIFLQMMSREWLLDGILGDNPFKEIHAFTLTTAFTGIEFRYEQRVKFVGKICYQDYTVNYADYPREFDAFLFSIGITNSIYVSEYIDGQYVGLHGQRYWVNFNRREIKTFKKAIKDII